MPLVAAVPRFCFSCLKLVRRCFFFCFCFFKQALPLFLLLFSCPGHGVPRSSRIDVVSRQLSVFSCEPVAVVSVLDSRKSVLIIFPETSSSSVVDVGVWAFHAFKPAFLFFFFFFSCPFGVLLQRSKGISRITRLLVLLFRVIEEKCATRTVF